MKINKTLTALIAGASIGMSGQAFSAGTTAGDDIVNTVSMSYKVGTSTLNATPATQTFKVDTKIDLTFTWEDGGLVTGTAADAVPFKLQVTNTGNDTQNFQFGTGEVADAVEVINGTAATADTDDWASITNFYADTDDSGDYNTGDVEYVGGLIADLVVDTPTTVFAVLTAPDDALDNAVIGAELKLFASNSSGVALTQNVADDKNANLTANYIVFAESTDDSALVLAPDGVNDRDGARVVMIGSDIQAANLVATKSVIVKDDGLDGNPVERAIPGAIVTYTIEVENRGRAAATDVNVLDIVNDIVGLKDGSVVYDHSTQFTYSGAATVTNSSDATKIDILLDSLVKDDSTDGTGDDYLKIVFDAEVE